MGFSESVFEKGKFVTKIFFYNNVEWRSSKKLRKMIFADDVKTKIKQL